MGFKNNNSNHNNNDNKLPAIGKDWKHFVEVFVPVFTLADKPTERREPCFTVLNSDLFSLGVAEQHPVTNQLNAESTLSLRRRHELCEIYATGISPFRFLFQEL